MLALIYRLTTASQSRVRYIVMGLAVVISVDSMVFVLVTIFQCRCVLVAAAPNSLSFWQNMERLTEVQTYRSRLDAISEAHGAVHR